MSKKIVCDRCGREIEGDTKTEVTIYPYIGNSVDFDLCSQCLEGFGGILENFLGKNIFIYKPRIRLTVDPPPIPKILLHEKI